MNTPQELTLYDDFQGKLVVLDFFTYCCINCLHILPDLKRLENIFGIPDGVAVVGIHSAKFENEKLSTNISHAVQRYDISHPVVNDKSASLWAQLDITCWPTLVLLSPDHYILLVLSGEGKTDLLIDVLKYAVPFYTNKNMLNKTALRFDKCMKTPYCDVQELQYPGKIAINFSGTQLAISDSGNHRIIICDIDGTVQVY